MSCKSLSGGGRFVYRAVQDHECAPPSDANIGDVWRCNCGQHWLRRAIPRIGGRRWMATEWPR